MRPVFTSLAQQVERLDAASRNRPLSLPAYNAAVRETCVGLENSRPPEFARALRKLGVSLIAPDIQLPLRRVEIAPESTDAGSGRAGIPVVMGYDTKLAPLYPPEGLFVDGTAAYFHSSGKAKFVIQSGPGSVTLNGRPYALAIDPTAAANHLKTRAKAFANTGFMSMIRPGSMKRKSQVFLLDPYDPRKTPLLMVHGLQSTPVAFAALVNALRSDPQVRAKFQIWQFYYASGTPVLANATTLRDSLNETLHTLDPENHDAATRRIVVIGHSMGGVISHTLVCASRDRLWNSVFRVPPDRLAGDREAIRDLAHIFNFQRNPRVGRVIFMAAPHRGSPMADSLVGIVGNALTRLSPMQENGFSQLARVNRNAMTPEAAIFYRGRFSAVRTLSSKSPALMALSGIPIEVPFHSIIGQQHPGAKEQGSDGVVPYASSHLDGARSELIVRSGHNVIDNADAFREVIRILHLDQKESR